MSKLSVYKVYKRPDSIVGLMCAILTGRAGDGVGVGHHWYHFRHGRGFVRDRLDVAVRSKQYDIRRVRDACANDVCVLDEMIGRKWSLINNCFVVSERFLRDGR